jgi:hypothetical protein
MMLLLGVCLCVDGIAGGLRVAHLLVELPGRDAVFAVALMARMIASALGIGSGWWLLRKHPQGRALAPVALIASAALSTVDLVWAVTPSHLFPTWRGPAVGVGWIWAIGWTLLLRYRPRSA